MRKWLGIASVLALLGGCIYLFFALFEPYEKTVDTGWGPEAIRNPYLAAEQFLQRAGIETRTLNSLYDPSAISGVDTVFIEDSRNVLSQRSVALLTGWVQRGGHLIVAAHPPADGSDPLLSAFDVSLRYKDCACEKQEQAPAPEQNEGDTAEPQEESPRSLSEALREYNRMMRGEPGETAEWENHEAGIDPAELTRLEFTGVEETLHAHFDSNWVLYHPTFEPKEEDTQPYEGIQPFYSTGTEAGVTFMQMEIGGGLVSILVSPDIWDSREIAYFDHAYLLYTLASDATHLRMLVGSHMPSLFTLGWQHGREVIIAFSCWLLAWLLYRGRRFLPPLPLTVTVRRSLAEHIRAVADFLWRHRSSRVLLEPLREDIEFQARLNLSGYAAMNPQDKYQALAERCGAPAQDVYRAMTETDLNDEDRFTDVIQLLQTIRVKL